MDGEAVELPPNLARFECEEMAALKAIGCAYSSGAPGTVEGIKDKDSGIKPPDLIWIRFRIFSLLDRHPGVTNVDPMKLSVRAEYALRALLVLGQHYGPDVVRIQTISEEQNIPKKFLEQILNDMKTLGVVESRRGMGGGYRLARPPARIALAEVIRHVAGALAPISCASENFYERCTCPDESRCAIREVMKETREAIVKIMERVTVADLVERSRRLAEPSHATGDYMI